MRYLKRLRHKISNLIYYFKVIWNDENWDHYYIEELLLKKLERVQDHYSNKKGYILEWVGMEDEFYKPLRICINILKRRKEEWYCSTWHNQNFNDIACNFDGNPIYAYKHISKGLKSFSEIEGRDLNNLYKILAKYSQRWWD